MTNYRQLPFRQKFWYGSLPASLQEGPLNTVLARVPKIKIHSVVSVAARAKNHSGVTRHRGSTLRMNMWFTSDLGRFDKHMTSFSIFRWQGLQCSTMTNWPKNARNHTNKKSKHACGSRLWANHSLPHYITVSMQPIQHLYRYANIYKLYLRASNPVSAQTIRDVQKWLESWSQLCGSPITCELACWTPLFVCWEVAGRKS